MKTASLYYRNPEENSDKEYHLKVEKSGSGYLVNFQYGRRGGTLTPGSKTETVVDLETAERIFDRLYQEKFNKGYRPAQDGKPPANNWITNIVGSALRTPFPVEKLEEISAEVAQAYISNPKYWAQIKCDGHFCQIQKRADGSFLRFNKLGGLVPGFPAEVVADLRKLKAKTFFLAGELIGNKLVCENLLELNGKDLSKRSYADRYTELEGLILSNARHVTIVTTWKGAEEKVNAVKMLRERRAEGVVFKLASAPYRSGNSGQHRKFKFVKTASVIVVRKGDKGHNSATIGLNDSGKLREVGHVSLNGKPHVEVGEVIEAAYLYASEGHRLVQARMIGKRDDVQPSECSITQIVYKGAVA